ncbi:DNA gyrase subunit A [Planktothrix tepida]|uniref:DNA gyrase subunit A n=2 Tax=Planktothrix TaxID=54304 RepID=A0A1J1LU08_9CYAN|nr:MULTISPECIES: DNA topoisomerase (ATP-hydrolyzing) subunit A [Planktothrix]CAD5930600.1 DNA gyrase subunit A [Planktothrix pseudagardhii]CAD5978373.1 DNA gyrase subunit A [Planktothrix tepida]CUR36077.1 DNA gyrase subunit A [Planktothrix tepida PCC 9214]
MSTSESRIIPTDLRNEMQQSYLEYAMSVIVGRALPDARDGLKPVHRRILYAMNELGLTPDRPFRKCARVVGEVLGKYHPHGDVAVYDALVRMAQDFSMRSPLINGHGNFGSVDNDPPAAMRYTECRLQALTTDSLLRDIDAETVEFGDNFDGSQQEPLVLPARIPQLLLNGSSGIAVGMATNIPPHNLGELVDGLVALIHNPEITIAELMRHIPGPDFPTGAQILGTSGIKEAYTDGRGSITMRGVATIETIEHRGRPDRDAIIITQLPYQTNKAAMIERIAEMVNDKKLEGISDIRDESDRDGMRIVIELKRDAYARVVLNNLYKQTPLQTNFGANMLALVNSRPEILNLKRFLEVFLQFREQTIRRRTEYELRKAQERDHLLQGLLIALDNLDAIIALIRHAADIPIAKQELMTNYGLSEQQADAILQMQLRRLTALEAQKIDQEHQELQIKIADLYDILARRERILEIVEQEALELKQKFNTPRRTVIEHTEGELDETDLIANEKALILLTEQGYMKRMPVNTFTAQSRATKGKQGTKMKEDDEVQHFITCCDHDTVLFFSERGVVYSIKAYQIPVASRTARGVPIVQMLPIPKEERITSIVHVSEFSDDEYLVMLTKGGFIKKTQLSAFSNIRTNGLIAISLEEGDELRWVRRAKVEDGIIIGSRYGMAIHFKANDKQLRPLGRATRGVKAMKLKGDDSLISMDILPSAIISNLAEAEGEEPETDEELTAIATETTEENETETEVVTEGTAQGLSVLVITASGYGKRVPVSQFRLQNRAGKGIIATKFKPHAKKDEVVALKVVDETEELMLISSRGIIIRQVVNAIPLQSRSATGVRVQRLYEEDSIAAVAIVPASGEDAEATSTAEESGEEE